MLRFMFISILLLIVTLGHGVAESGNVNPYLKATLQVTMQQHIDRHLVNGAYLHLDETSGEVVQLYPVSPHPVIMRMGNYFVLCADFRNDQGKTVNVDFYMARSDRRYVVFHTKVDQREVLNRWLKTGQVTRLD